MIWLTKLRRSWTCVLTLILVASAFSAAAGTPKRLLILDSFGRDIAPFNTAVSSFRTTLAREMGEPVDIYEASLDAARFAEPEKEAPFLEFLKFRFVGRSLDLVVPVGAPAVKFVAKHRASLFPGTPVVFMGVDPRMVSREAFGTNTTLVTQRVNLPGIIEDVLQIQPVTTNIAVIFGASPLEKFWVGECRREFQSFTNRVGFTWLNDLPLDRILERVAALPPHSFILFGMLVTDATGVPYDNDEALNRVHAVANAPVFGYFASEFGQGIVGGRLYQDAEVGRLAARAATRILRGDRPEDVPVQILESSVPTFDARELERWGISEARLPAGSVVQFRKETIWELYRWRIVGVLLLSLAQTVLIVFLVVSRRRLGRAEAAAHELSGRLIGAQEKERARLARELHDDVTQRLALLAIDAGRALTEGAGAVRSRIVESVREGLVRLSEDVHALAYRLHPSVLEDLGLAEALKAEGDRFSRQHAVLCEVKLRDVPAVIPAEAALCLFRVAQGALRNVARHARARSVQVLLRGMDGGLQLGVQDDGVGFEPSEARRSPSLGLASMRERIILAGGELGLESAPGRGTTVLAWVPLDAGGSGLYRPRPGA
jgi:signal transduction histidine kinase